MLETGGGMPSAGLTESCPSAATPSRHAEESNASSQFSKRSSSLGAPSAASAIRFVEKLMRRYPSWPVLGWDKEGNLSFGRLSHHLKRAEQEEAEAALAVMSLAEVNELIWLRRCLCKKWFFACRKTQKSCSSTCRHRLYEQTDRFRANRRKYMKRYYRLKRSGKVK